MQNISNSFFQLASRTFSERVEFVLEKIWTDVNEFAIKNAIGSAYTRENFKTNSICPIMKISECEYMAEMFYGPSGSFKDIYSLLLPFIIPSRKLAVMASSGNGALAAANAFASADRTRLLIFYPKSSICEEHYLGLVTNANENVTVVGVNGDLEDIQKNLDSIVQRNERLVLLHSIHLGKSAPLAACIIALYCELLFQREIKIGEPLNIVLPFKHSSLQHAYDLAVSLGLPTSSIDTKSLIIESDIEEANIDIKALREKPIISDAIVSLGGMENFIRMVS